jgi:hypothetical protein
MRTVAEAVAEHLAKSNNLFRPAFVAFHQPWSLHQSLTVCLQPFLYLQGPDSRPLLMGYGGRLYSSSSAASAGEGGVANAAGLTNVTALMAGAAARSLHRIGSSNFGSLLRTLSAGHLPGLAGSRANSLQRAGSSQGMLDRAALAAGSSTSIPGGLRTVSEDQAVQDLTQAGGDAAAAAAAAAAVDSTTETGDVSSSSRSESAVGDRVEAAVKAAAALLGFGGLLPLLGPNGEKLALNAYGRLVAMPGRKPLTGEWCEICSLSCVWRSFAGVYFVALS